MCGIAGFIGHQQLAPAAINETLARMCRRGPDAQSFREYHQQGMHVYLLHSRLAIIDLDSRSNQPFEREHAALTFNGEIYNYIELRKQLLACGRTLSTESDTEVLIQSYLQNGSACVTSFEGMWSFALYDQKKNELLLSRDRFGEKPLFYLQTKEGIYFASEVKFIQALAQRRLEPNQQQVLRYLVNGYRALNKGSETYWQGIESVPHASLLRIGSNLNPVTERYWKLEYAPVEMTEQQAIEGTRQRLYESMRLRLRSDVPIAFCLSGGVDSAGLASIAAKEFQADVSCYSIIDSDERYNEYENIKATVNDISCAWFPIEITHETSFDRLRDLVRYHDAPVATISYYVHSFLAERISSQGKKVAFSGTSADELFTGYYDHYLFHLAEMQGSADFESRLKEWQQWVLPKTRNPKLQNPDYFVKNPNFRDHIYLDADEFAQYLRVPFQEAFTEQAFTQVPLRNRMLNELFHEATPVILAEDDLNSMRYSIENRSPYLDSKLAEFAFTIPSRHLIKNGYAKNILREALKGTLNDKVRLDRQKKGFNAAIESVFSIPHNQFRENLLDQSPIYEIVDRTKVEALLNNVSYTNSYSKFLFSLISAKLFLELADVG